MSKLYLLVLVAVLGAAATVLPGLAAGDSPPASASFSAMDFAWNASGGGTQVTIAQGGTVSFGYPSGSSRHNVDFSGGAAPTSCSQTAGASSGSVPPLPNQPTTPGWTGSCTFSTPGTYTFHCDLHPSMTGTIVVEAPGGTTNPGGPPPGPGPTPPTTTTTGSGSTPTVSPSAFSVALNHTQRGHAITGSVLIPSTYQGGTLQVDVVSGRLRVGHLVRQGVAAGTLHFSARVPRAVHRHGPTGFTVQVTLRAPGRSTRFSRFRVLLSP